MAQPDCGYCGAPAVLKRGRDMPFRQHPNYAERWFWACLPCGAWVGCHPGSTRALGSLANAALRERRTAVHAFLEPIWQRWVDDGMHQQVARNGIYAFLACEMRLPVERCHVAMFSFDQCNKAIAILRRVR